VDHKVRPFLSFEIGQPVKCTLQDYHDRMPVLLKPEQFELWLSGESGQEALVPASEDMLDVRAVSKRVNSSRTSDDDATLIDAVAA
jgi:putative SOS response-associated peptidase YedK